MTGNFVLNALSLCRVPKSQKYPLPGHEDGFALRLRQVLDAYGNTSSIARAIDRSEGAVRKWLRGESEPNVSDLRALCQATGTNVEWLVMGRGNRLGPSEIRDPPAVYATPMPPPLDYRLLDAIMAMIEDEARTAGLEIISPKRTSILAVLYNLFRDSKQIDREAVTRMVSLAGERAPSA
jgi:transcriptional regulator with XRE-family HTH domain